MVASVVSCRCDPCAWPARGAAGAPARGPRARGATFASKPTGPTKAQMQKTVSHHSGVDKRPVDGRLGTLASHLLNCGSCTKLTCAAGAEDEKKAAGSDEPSATPGRSYKWPQSGLFIVGRSALTHCPEFGEQHFVALSDSSDYCLARAGRLQQPDTAHGRPVGGQA